MPLKYASLHNHTSYSNLKLIDSINKVEDLIDYGYELGLHAIAITDHDCLGAHIKALKHFKKNYKDKDYKLILGNEIYISREGLTNENYEPGEKFYHCILLAKDEIGHRQIRELSTRAWRDNGFFRVIMRTPTYLSDIEEIVGQNPGHLICTTACLGSLPGVQFQRQNYGAITAYLEVMKELFGDDFYIELQPNTNEDQRSYNRYMWQNYSQEYKFTVATDSHYLKKTERSLHRDFLQSKESSGNREVDEFYSSAYLMSAEEVMDYMLLDFQEYEVMDMFANSIEMADKCGEYSLDHPQIVPKIQYEWSKRDEESFANFTYLMEKYNFNALDYYLAQSPYEADRYLAYLIGEGFMEKIFRDWDDDYSEYFARLDEELTHIRAISDSMKQPLSDYFNTMAKIIEIIWTDGDSLVGPGRGSGCGSLINYLVGITQLDPLRQELSMPFWRFMHSSRPELPDIDFDTEAQKRTKIFNAVQKYFKSIGSEVLNVCTVGTLGTKSSIRTAGKGLEMEDAVINYIVSLVPSERGKDWTLDECRFGSDEKQRISQFATQMATYPQLWTLAKRIEGLVTNLSVHASGVLIMNGSATEHNSVMKTSKGICVTAWDLHDSEEAGGLKYDFLTVQGIDKIRACMSYLLDLNLMEWQGSLKATYDQYLLPANLDYTTPEMWEMASNGEIAELFQFDTVTGGKAIRSIKPTSLGELATSNSIMRLMCEGEQPIDVFIRNKNNIKAWYNEMDAWGLNKEEMAILERHLLKVKGVAASQESVMQLSMDPQVAGFTIKEANALRKGIAKKKPEVIEATRQLFYQKGSDCGTSLQLLDYIWKRQIGFSLGYSFSDLHTVAYSTIALQEMNLAYYYPVIVWNCACLSVDADAIDENSFTYMDDIADYWVDDEEEEEDVVEGDDSPKKKKASKVNYDKIAMALGHFKDINIELPDINEAKLGFIPNIDNNSIMFGLKGLSKIGDDIVTEIIARRPYTSLEDFIQKMKKSDGKTIISKDKIINLIKAGCFDKLLDSREKAMKYYLNLLVPPKKNVTLQNMGKLIEYDMLPEELNFEKGVYLFTKEARKNKDGNGYYILDEIMYQWFCKWMKQEPPKFEGVYKINSTKWDALYDIKMEKVRTYLRTNKDALIKKFYDIEFGMEWDKYCKGDELQWELDSLNFYHSGHPLTNVKLPYDVDPITALVDNEFDGYWNIKGNKVPKMVIRRIQGTVLVKNKQKNLIVLSTPDGVIQCKIYKSQFAKYDKVVKNSDGEVLEPSFLDKGTHLMMTGVLRDGIFVPKVYKDTGHEPIMKIILTDQNEFVELVDKRG